MPGPQLVIIRTLEDLRGAAADWDDLWRRSDTALPTLRAELLVQWLETFAPQDAFRLLTVRDGGRLLAALPLVSTPLKGPLRVAALPGNPWCTAGELLLDPAAGPPTLQALAGGLQDLPWPLIRFLDVEWAAPRWQRLWPALQQQGMQAEERAGYSVGQVEIPADWDAFEAAWSRNHRRQIRRITARLEKEGDTQLENRTAFDPAELEPLLQTAFEVEDRSWKGEAGTSVLRSPGMFAFFLRQARQLAEWGQLEISLLHHAGRPIALNYGYRAKQTTFAFKVGYDAGYSQYSPGQALMFYLLRAYHAGGSPPLVDFAGPLQDWTGKWATRTYDLRRLTVAPRRISSRWLLAAYAQWLPRLSAWKDRLRKPAAAPSPPPGEPAGEEQQPPPTREPAAAAAD